MGFMKTLGVCALASLLLVTGPAGAQENSDDWDFGQDASRNLTIAAVTFDNFGVAVRCMNDSLSVVVSGLPQDSGRRSLGWRMGDEPDQQTAWVSPPNSASAFSIWPRSVATSLSHGGALQIAARDGDSTRRYTVDIPPSGQAVGRVFEACGLSLTSPTTAPPSGESFAGLRWARAPEPSFPSRNLTYGAGLAALRCTAQANGSLRDCQVESEFPEGAGFGRAAVLGAHRTGRVAAIEEGQSVAGRTIVFLTRYGQITGGWLEPPPSRLPNRDEIYNPVRDED
jgi:hypothetical protein